MNYSEQILNERFDNLPKDIQEAIIATPWKEKLGQISKKHNLHIDQAGRLSEETILVMFGLEHPNDLIGNIAKHVEVSQEKAETIANDLNQEIFLKIRESLKKIFEEKKEFAPTEPAEEMLDRETILREIEDKEHPKNLGVELPNKESSLGAQLPQPSNIQKLPEIRPESGLDAPIPSEIEPVAPTTKVSEGKRGDIFKDKMTSVVNIPKETVNVTVSMTSPKKIPSDTDKKFDPYREQF